MDAIPSYLDRAHLGPWEVFLEQVDRVAPHLGDLGYFEGLMQGLEFRLMFLC